jgi:hypothetical protein
MAAESLALKLGSDTNNTSLALAFELGPPGRGPVLLFPGDAQVGSWWSWEDLDWHVAGRNVTAADLLARTLVYKCGHHASHNGTVKSDRDGAAWGLELMPRKLIALIPVDEETAHKTGGVGKKWDMPARNLYDMLKEKTDGRILRSDEPPYPKPRDDQKRVRSHDGPLDLPEPGPEFHPVPGIPSARWRRGRDLEGRALFYDVEISAAKA